MILPSKDLLSAVIDGCKTPHILELDGNKLYFYKNIGSNITSINIYELMHMMKEWAFDNGYDIETAHGYVCVENNYDVGYIKNSEYSETDMVTEACEWIMEQIK